MIYLSESKVFTFSPIFVGCVHKLLKCIPIRTDCYLDGINGRFLTVRACRITRPLTHFSFEFAAWLAHLSAMAGLKMGVQGAKPPEALEVLAFLWVQNYVSG